MEIFNRKKLVIVLLSLENKIFITYIIFILRSIIKMVYLFKKTLIIFLNFKEVIIFIKYFDFTNIFLFNLIIKLLKDTSINNYFISLV